LNVHDKTKFKQAFSIPGLGTDVWFTFKTFYEMTDRRSFFDAELIFSYKKYLKFYFEVLSAVAMKGCIFWDITLLKSADVSEEHFASTVVVEK
jgi:hypothetical protein